MDKSFVCYQDLMALGFKQHTARDIIRQAKQRMVQKGYPLYLNRNLGRVPRSVVESIFGSPMNGAVENE